MGRIPVYNNQLFPNEQPLAEAARAAGQAGYFRGQLIERGFSALGQGVNRLMAGLEERTKTDKTAQRAAEQEDIANLTSGFAGAGADLTVDWSTTLQKAQRENPGDRTVAQKWIEETLTTQLGEITGSATTDKGRQYAQKTRARLFSQFYKGANADQANMLATHGVNQAEETVRSYSVKTAKDPTMWAENMALADDAIDAQADAYGFDPAPVKEKTRYEIAHTALNTKIENTPEIARKELADGVYDKYLNGKERLMAEDKIARRIDELEEQGKAERTAVMQSRRNEADVKLRELDKTVKVSENGKRYIYPQNYIKNLEAINNEYGDVLSRSEIHALKSAAMAEMRREDGDEGGHDDFTWGQLYSKLRDGSLTEAQVNTAYSERRIKRNEWQQLLKDMNKPADERAGASAAKDFLETKTAYLGDRTTPLVANRAQDYVMDMLARRDRDLAAGKTDEEWMKYASSALPAYVITQKEMDAALAVREGEIYMLPDIEPPNLEISPDVAAAIKAIEIRPKTGGAKGRITIPRFPWLPAPLPPVGGTVDIDVD